MAKKKDKLAEGRSTSFDPDLLIKIEQQAKEEGRTFSGMVNFMALKYLKDIFSEKQNQNKGM